MLTVAIAAAVAGAAPLTLDEVRTASRASLDAIKAELDLAKASEGVRLSRSVILPQVDLRMDAKEVALGPRREFNVVPTAQGTYVSTPVEVPSVNQAQFSLALSVAQLLYDGGRWWNQIAQSGAQERAAKGQLAEQQLASELEAVRRFYELLKAQLSLEVLRATATRSREQVGRAQALYEAGRGPRSAVFDAMTSLANDEVAVERQRRAIVVARLNLLQWLGRPDADVEAVAPAGLESPAPAPSLEAALGRAKEQRPLVMALEEAVRAGELGVSVAWANHLPSLSAAASYGRAAPTGELFVDLEKQHQLQVGLTLKLNLFNGLGYDAQLKQAEVEARRARALQRQGLVDLEAELAKAHEVLASEARVLAINETNEGTARAQLNLEVERFSAGAGSNLEVRNAQTKFTQAQLAVLSGRADVAVARAALERAIGGAVP